MNLNILSFKIIEEPSKKRFLFCKTKEKSYTINIEYNIDEDRFYYNDETKNIPTKKDLCRSILIIYEIYKRYEKFHLNDRIILLENNLETFLDNFLNSNNIENNLYYKRMIFGSKSININSMNFILDTLGIDNVDFNDYYFINYTDINFI